MYLYAIVCKSQQEYTQASCFIPDTRVTIYFRIFPNNFKSIGEPRNDQKKIVKLKFKVSHYA